MTAHVLRWWLAFATERHQRSFVPSAHRHLLRPSAFGTRFESGVGTNPEELIGAAHAGCFSMALSAELQKAGFVAETISTSATVTFEQHPQTGWTVTQVHLDTTATVPGITTEKFAAIADGAKAGCPISRLLKAAISLDAKLL